MAKIPRKGIPRTAAAADRRQLRTLGFNFSTMDPAEMEKYKIVHVDTAGAKGGSLGLIGTLPPKIVPGTEPGTHLACYYEDSTGDYTRCYIVHDM